RYKEGAPLAVVVAGGVGPDGLAFDMHAAQTGMIEVRFEMPGGVYKKVASSGIFDNRGQNCQLALRDVIQFAAGKKVDARGNTIANDVPVPVATNNVGLVGWANGGNLAIITMAKYADS